MSRGSTFLLAFVLLLLAPLTSFGQVDPNRSIEMREKVELDLRWIDLREKGALVFQKSVQEDLKLSEEQMTKLKSVLGQVYANELKSQQLLQAAKPEDAAARNKKIKEYFEAVDSTLADIFTADQSQRLQQIHLQSLGVLAIMRPTYSETLELSRQQKSQARRLGSDLMRLGIPTRPGTVEDQKNKDEAKKKINEQFLGLLDEEQKGKWEKLLGKPFDFRPDEVRDSRVAAMAGDRPVRPYLPSENVILAMKMQVLSKPAVRTELQLTDSQIAILDEAQSEIKKLNKEASKRDFEVADRNQEREERARRTTQTEQATKRAISENLTADQLRRLIELYLQNYGPDVFDQSDIVKALGLDDRQQTDVTSIKRQFLTENMTAFRAELSEEDKDKVRKKRPQEEDRRNARLLELLTKEQRSKWDQMLGKPFPIEQLKGSDNEQSLPQVTAPSQPNVFRVLLFLSSCDCDEFSDTNSSP